MSYSNGRKEPKYRKKHKVERSTIMSLFLTGEKEIDKNRKRTGKNIKELG